MALHRSKAYWCLCWSAMSMWCSWITLRSCPLSISPAFLLYLWSMSRAYIHFDPFYLDFLHPFSYVMLIKASSSPSFIHYWSKPLKYFHSPNLSDSALAMKLLSTALSLVFAAGFFQSAAAERIDCLSNCAACWKIGSTTGEDIKMPCNLIWGCPFTCPSGYDRVHCAKESRCE